MYIWYITVFLKNGTRLCGKLNSDEQRSDKIAIELMGDSRVKFSGIVSMDNNTQIFFNVNEVSALTIGKTKYAEEKKDE